jgi:hypothetical protein
MTLVTVAMPFLIRLEYIGSILSIAQGVNLKMPEDPRLRSVVPCNLTGSDSRVAVQRVGSTYLCSAKPILATAWIYRVPDSIDNVLRAFNVTRAATGADVDKAPEQVRMATRSSWVFPYESHRAIVFRGTTAQMAQAERVIEEMNKP